MRKKTCKKASTCGGVAQLGEHLLCKQGVRSSILLISTINREVEKGNRRTEELPSDDMGA